MGTQRLAGKRILITCAEVFMGPAIVDLFRDEDADVIADLDLLLDPEAPARLITDTGSPSMPS